MVPLPFLDVKAADAAAHGAVDTHFHVFPRLAHAAPGARYLPDYCAPLDRWARRAAAHGVTHGVVVQPSFLGTDHAALLEALAAMPQRLRAVAVPDPAADRRELERMGALGVRGVRLNLVGQPHRLDAAQARLLARTAEQGWHVEAHTDPGALAWLLPQLPAALVVVVDHFGKPDRLDDTALWRAVRDRAETLYVKLSAPYRLAAGIDAARLARRWLAELGPARLLWGSDWPCTAHEDQQRQAQAPARLREWLPDETVAQQVLIDNPRRLYGF